jgi:hypothetical protein
MPSLTRVSLCMYVLCVCVCVCAIRAPWSLLPLQIVPEESLWVYRNEWLVRGMKAVRESLPFALTN